ncbi:hypothetical protein KEM54_002110 [Ascosphaera aggregata]|nr:hypothetical protein KEM54_002110 [Ascosphaera aggregata]
MPPCRNPPVGCRGRGASRECDDLGVRHIRHRLNAFRRNRAGRRIVIHVRPWFKARLERRRRALGDELISKGSNSPCSQALATSSGQQRVSLPPQNTFEMSGLRALIREMELETAYVNPSSSPAPSRELAAGPNSDSDEMRCYGYTSLSPSELYQIDDGREGNGRGCFDKLPADMSPTNEKSKGSLEAESIRERRNAGIFATPDIFTSWRKSIESVHNSRRREFSARREPPRQFLGHPLHSWDHTEMEPMESKPNLAYMVQAHPRLKTALSERGSSMADENKTSSFRGQVGTTPLREEVMTLAAHGSK